MPLYSPCHCDLIELIYFNIRRDLPWNMRVLYRFTRVYLFTIQHGRSDQKYKRYSRKKLVMLSLDQKSKSATAECRLLRDCMEVIKVRSNFHIAILMENLTKCVPFTEHLSHSLFVNQELSNHFFRPI